MEGVAKRKPPSVGKLTPIVPRVAGHSLSYPGSKGQNIVC
jgi:hypothetical protein